MEQDSKNAKIGSLSNSAFKDDYVMDLKMKKTLSLKDMKFIFNLPKGEREEILENRVWHLIILKGDSYIDNVLNYQYNATGESADDYGPVKENLKKKKKIEVLKNACMKKEECVPWKEFKNTERWQPSERDGKIFSMALEMKIEDGNYRNDHHNGVNFRRQLQYGDPVLVHDGFAIQGYWRHAGIGYLKKPLDSQRCTVLYPYIISSYHNKGVIMQEPEYFNGYDEGVLLRVNAYYTRCIEAQNYAHSKIGYPYNDNWLNKWPTNKYYCSQLVWAAYYWTNPRIDIDATPNNNWVSPDDIFNDGDTYVVQHSW